ncbi:MAG: alpha-L-arabinofuranosidase C-terminal domain-containing protein [Verrucomicrobiota bacterium]
MSAPSAPVEAPHAVLTIDTVAPTQAISPLLFGGFIEHFTDQIYGGLFEPGSPIADERGFRKDVIAAMKELKLSVVRWPGGCFVSGYHWKDGIGKTRKPVADPVWGATDPNTFGTDEFIAWCRLVGCEPYICTNAGNGSPAEMQQWVEYCNASTGEYATQRKSNGNETPFNVKYWSIGNENYGPWEIGRKDADKWGPLVDECAVLMRAADPTIKLAAAATKKEDWSLPLLAAAGKHLDYVALHEYWFGFQSKNMMPKYQDCILRSEGPEKTLQTMLGILDKAGCRGRVKVAFDEWNLRGWHHPGFPRKKPLEADDADGAAFIAKREINKLPQQYSMADALFSASFFNACLRHSTDVAMTNIAPIVNTRGPLFVHPKGIVKRTTFHILAMYANLLENHVAAASVVASPYGSGKQQIPVIDAVATVDPAGKNRALALVNRHPDQAGACTVNIGTVPLDGTFDATILAGDSPDAYNDVDHPARVVPEHRKLTFIKGTAKLPPHSLTIVRVPAP